MSSWSLPAWHLNNSISFPTVSVDSFLGAARCFLVTESAFGCIDSLRCRDMVTMLILTGAVTPLSGLTSTVPSIRGYNDYTLVLYIGRAHGQPHQCRRDSRIANKEVCIWSTCNPHECAHVSIRTGVLRAAWSSAFLFASEGGATRRPRSVGADAVYVMRRRARWPLSDAHRDFHRSGYLSADSRPQVVWAGAHWTMVSLFASIRLNAGRLTVGVDSLCYCACVNYFGHCVPRGER